MHEAYSPLPIDILIVGAGLSGLTAALECHRKDMSLRVLEGNPTIEIAGMNQIRFAYPVHARISC